MIKTIHSKGIAARRIIKRIARSSKSFGSFQETSLNDPELKKLGLPVSIISHLIQLDETGILLD